jgi:probable F420-dependent oxidoreductase
MKLGLGLPQRSGVDLRRDITEVARTAEEAGFTSLWVLERLLFPLEPQDGMYGIPGLPWAATYEEIADPLAVLTVAAAVTDRIRLGTGVLVAPLYIPVKLAKALATIDQISGGGRLIAGLGAGWSSDEAQAVGRSLAERGSRLDETIDVLRAAWGADPVSFEGRYGHASNVLIRPKPRAPIPVMLGGGASQKALDRIARRADGWLPSAVPPAQLGGAWRQIREAATVLGRDSEAMELINRANVVLTDGPAGDDRWPFIGDLDQVVGDIVTCARAGTDELIIDLQFQEPFGGTKQLLDTALEIQARVLAAGI